jgi:hypothetical protein
MQALAIINRSVAAFNLPTSFVPLLIEIAA